MTDQGAAGVTHEQRQRFWWLRELVRDEQRRQRTLFVLGLLSLLVFSLLAFLADTLQVLPFDLAATRELQELRSGLLLRAMVAISLPGYSPWSLIIVGAGALAIGALLGWRDGAFLLALTGLQGLANLLIKLAIGRPRPLSSLVDVVAPVSGNSFPSGHVMFYTVFFGFLFFLAWARLPASLGRAAALTICGGLVLLIGPSRMYLGAHWLSDVIAAHLLGLIILTFGIEFYLRYVSAARPAAAPRASP